MHVRILLLGSEMHAPLLSTLRTLLRRSDAGSPRVHIAYEVRKPLSEAHCPMLQLLSDTLEYGWRCTKSSAIMWLV